MKKIAVLGSTGSVGTQCLEVIEKLKNLKKFQVIALSAGNNIKLLETQILKFNPEYVCVKNKQDAEKLSKKFKNINFFSGTCGLCEIAKIQDTNLVFNSVAGFSGIYASFSALKSGKNLALANKESIVAGGDFLINIAKKNNCEIFPVDSEHSAIWQCINNNKKIFLKKIILTASGGPFFGKNKKELENISIKDVLKHPTWNMGAKISVDSATMMNKGLEIIEAAYLFNISKNLIDVLIHPQSIVHSMIELVDGNILAQMSMPNMKFPIQYALTYPERLNYSNNLNLNLASVKKLSFYEPDSDTREILNLCRDTIGNNSLSCALNAINEVAVSAFLQEKIKFLDIINIIKKSMYKINSIKIKCIEDIIYCDKTAREIANKFI
ncbi:MAG: 1-deoxy-D-xylulose-5-phosphate reductoisomerase [Clostridia bacterium]|nr:1-deoxy-D-xylulose-5-phosphate reductoisomerase [Clostridia bacterium]